MGFLTPIVQDPPFFVSFVLGSIPSTDRRQLTNETSMFTPNRANWTCYCLHENSRGKGSTRLIRVSSIEGVPGLGPFSTSTPSMRRKVEIIPDELFKFLTYVHTT